MPKFCVEITLSDERVLMQVMVSIQEWVENALHHRVYRARKELLHQATAYEIALHGMNGPIIIDIDELLESGDFPTAAERQGEHEATLTDRGEV